MPRKPPLHIPDILEWADNHFTTHGSLLKSYIGTVCLNRNEKSRNIDNTLRFGGGGSQAGRHERGRDQWPYHSWLGDMEPGRQTG